MQHRVVAEVKTDRDGRFAIKVRPHEAITLGDEHRITYSMSLLATANRFGPDAFQEVDRVNVDDEIKLTLVKDTVPLQGRVLDLESRPIAGVRLRVRSIRTAASDLDAWIAKARNNPPAIPDDFRKRAKVRQQIVYFPSEKGIEVEGLPMFPAVTTDAHGRFRLDGLGPDRFISLELDGPSVAKDWISAVTRSMPTVPLPTGDPRSRTERCFGAKFDYTAEPTQVITGLVRDLDTKEPIVGAVVNVYQFGGSLLGLRGFVSTTSDENGRYRLAGIPKRADGARPIRLEVLPDANQPYFLTDVTVSEKFDGFGPVNFDIELKRAIWVTGRLIDQQSGKPTMGYVSYYPFH